MSILTDTVHREMTRHLVSRAISCPRTGEILDVRTCVVILDGDGDPYAVMSQAGWAQIVAEGNDKMLEKNAGLKVDAATVKA